MKDYAITMAVIVVAQVISVVAFGVPIETGAKAVWFSAVAFFSHAIVSRVRP